MLRDNSGLNVFLKKKCKTFYKPREMLHIYTKFKLFVNNFTKFIASIILLCMNILKISLPYHFKNRYLSSKPDFDFFFFI